MFVNRLGSIFDTEFDELILEVDNELDVDDDKFFAECLYKNYEGILYLHITWNKHSHSPAKSKLIKMYDLKETGEFIRIVSKAECRAWLKCHGRYEDIEYYSSRIDKSIEYATDIALGQGEFEEF